MLINTFTISRGCLFYTGQQINDFAAQEISRIPETIKQRYLEQNQYHITILTADELKGLCAQKPGFNAVEFAAKKINVTDLSPVGLGQLTPENVWYVICAWGSANLARQQLGLPHKEFHITLGYSDRDCHTKSKGIDTLVCGLCELGGMDPRWLADPIIAAKLLQSYSARLSGQDLYQIAKSANKYNPEIAKQVAGLCAGDLFGLLLELNELKQSRDDSGIQDIITKRLLTQTWQSQIMPDAVQRVLAIANTYSDKRMIIQDLSKNGVDREIQFIRSPRNFSEIIPGLYGSSIPNRQEYFHFMSQLGITDIITIMETPLPVPSEVNLSVLGIKCHYFGPVQDLHPPTIEMMQEITNLLSGFDKSRKTVIHCYGGVGRTACVILAYLMYSKQIDKYSALEYLKGRKTILTETQNEFLRTWYKTCLAPKPVIKLPDMIVMVGYPASGKSTLANSIVESFGEDKVCRVNQDEIRKKGECQRLVGANVQTKCVILDRCNLTKAERAEWLDIAHRPASVWCIYYACDINDCKYRITRRKNHPTIKEGSGLMVLRTLSGKLEPPSLNEGFTQIIEIHDMDDQTDLMDKWQLIKPDISEFIQTEPSIETNDGDANCVNNSDPESLSPPNPEDFIIKFPRTRHILNVGAATRDDLIMTQEEVAKFLGREIIIEEKIDGANLGISITPSGKFLVQNRSHYVSSKEHKQFEKLDNWLQKHTADLWQILTPGRHILYGEWVYAKHSIHYTRLPGYFVVFDLYDKQLQKFVSRRRLAEILAETQISHITVVYQGVITKQAEFGGFLQQASQFYDGRIEGIYVRVCDDDYLLYRGKVVRNDFITGNSHWSKGQIEKNIII